MKNHPNRLAEVTAEQMAQFQAEADELNKMQSILDSLPLGLQVEKLSDKALDRLRKIAQSPAAVLCGDSLLLWNNVCRRRAGLTSQN